MKEKAELKLLLMIALIAIMFGCVDREPIKKIDITKKEKLSVMKQEANNENTIRFAVGEMITPREGFAYYRQLLDYIGEKIGKKVELVGREDYAGINELMKIGGLDAAFVCGGPYVDGHKDFGMELLAAPVAYGEATYYSYTIVHRDSGINSIEGLRGRTFAFTDPLSNLGKLAPTYMLAKMNETPETFFKSYDFSYAHDKSIEAVAERLVDGAAVDSLVWEYINHTNPELTSRTKIIKKSAPYGIPPVVARPGLATEIKDNISQAFLNIHNNERGREILEGMMIDKFVPIQDSAYDSIREMKQWVAARK